MREQRQDPGGYKPGDKVRIRSGPYTGARGVIRAEVDGALEIQLGTGRAVPVLPDEVTNYSLAARRAWQVMPKRAGRPRSPVPRKKMVSFRLDIHVWQMLEQAVKLGFIASQSDAINTWLRERLEALLNEESLSQEAHEPLATAKRRK